MTNNNKKFNKKSTLNIILFFSIVIIIVLFIFTINRTTKSQNLEETQILMNTPITLTLYGADEKILTTDKNEAFTLFSKIDKLSTRYDIIEGNIGYINKESGKTIIVDPLIVEQLETAITYSKKTNNQFNIALGKLIDLWKRKEIENILPTKDEINLSLKNIDISKILLENNKLTIPKDMILDLGAVSKGYAIEKIGQMLNAKQHLAGAIINGGGNIKVLGTPPGKNSYKIGIQDPRHPSQLIGTTILTHEETISTSGDYQRYYTINGIKYPHIFSSRTGFPANENIAVTVITKNSMLSDIISTILYLLSYEEGLIFLKNLPFKVEALWISKDLKITKTTDFLFTSKKQEGTLYL